MFLIGNILSPNILKRYYAWNVKFHFLERISNFKKSSAEIFIQHAKLLSGKVI